MNIMLKSLLSEEVTSTTENSPLRVQCYVDMDGVLVDMEKGFAAISGGLTPKQYETQHGKGAFWKVIGRKKDFWITLEAMPDAMVLWKFLSDNFKNPVPVILSAGQGSTVVQQKTEWIRKHISPSVKVMIAPSGVKKPEFVLSSDSLAGSYVTHVLIDDTQKNIIAWDNEAAHRIAIHHTSAAESIKALGSFIK